ncbi:MAG: hypothetical protein LRY46_01795 [Candidatus Pacebacteria bacterium]|nr:hypothetical protein [Candidatus Paceibacterota bacterium]
MNTIKKNSYSARGRGESSHKDFGAPKTMYKAICSDCGSKTEVPFKPSGDRPVLCNNCFSQQRDGDYHQNRDTRNTPKNNYHHSEKRESFTRTLDPSEGLIKKMQRDIDALHSKIDVMMTLMSSQIKDVSTEKELGDISFISLGSTGKEKNLTYKRKENQQKKKEVKSKTTKAAKKNKINHNY